MTGQIDRLSAHVLDTTLGRPAAGIPAILEKVGTQGSSVEVGHGVTDDDGRINHLNAGALEPGEYRLALVTAGYFAERHRAVFYPAIVLQFVLSGDRSHYHIAVLTSTYSYTTYLGS